MLLPTRVEQWLATWRHWQVPCDSAPEIVAPLRGGLTNRAYLIRCGQHKVVLRQHGDHAARLGVNREHERRVLDALAQNSDLKIAPRVLYWSPCGQFSVLEFIEGRVWSKADFVLSSRRQLLRQLIEVYQCINVDIPEFNYPGYLKRYWQLFKQAHPQRAARLQKRWRMFAPRLQNYKCARTLTHHDLVAGNIIEQQGRLFIIDWEYAGLGFAGLDLYAIRFQTRQNMALAAPFYSELLFWLNELWWGIHPLYGSCRN